MRLQPSRLLQLPAGSAALFLQEARTQQLLVRTLTDLYDSWGYLPVHTPLVDFSRAYEGLIPDSDLKRVYHLVDRDGDVLMLRWDITLFLVKQVRNLLKEAHLPLRLSYADSILRHQEAEDISRNEFFQTGIELIGLSGPDGDFEAILLLAAALRTLNAATVIHIGSRYLFNLAFGAMDAAAQESIGEAIRTRDEASANEILSMPGAFRETGPRRSLISLFGLIGNSEKVAESFGIIAGDLPASVRAEASRLIAFAAQIVQWEPEVDIRIDFSELGSQRYHSGIVFQAYADGIDSAVASGGRYDQLLTRLGCPSPAVGFSIMLSKIDHAPAALADIVRLSEKSQGEDFGTRYRMARSLRNEGKRVSL